MDEQFEHLTDAQIEQYGNQITGSGPDENRELETHLAACARCRTRVLASQRARLAVLADPDVKTAPHVKAAPHPDCPAEDDLRNLAAGLCPPDQASELTHHAAQCDFCGGILKMYSQDFSNQLTAEDAARIANLRSSSPEWQKELARKMISVAKNDSKQK